MAREALEGADSVVMDYSHYMVHDGQMYNASYVNLTVTASSFYEVLMVTGAKEPHINIGVDFGAAGRAWLYGDVTYTSDTTTSYGTALTIMNMKRSSTNTPDMTMYIAGSTPSWTASTLLYDESFGAATNKSNPVGGGVRQGTEWVLKPNTKYLLRLTNISAATASASFQAQFYEEA